MMDLSEIYQKAIRPAYAELPASMRTREATVLLLAIGLQESAFRYRRQIKGPARPTGAATGTTIAMFSHE